jgi:uncharacterized membrane-anchored protein
MNHPLRAPALALLAATLCLPFASHAQGAGSGNANDDSATRVERFIDSLHPASGTVGIPAAGARLNLSSGYSFLPAGDAQRVLTKLWHNPPDSDVLGMILPSADPHVLLDERAWAVVVTYVDDGYVSDADAASIDYGDMLKTMRKATHDHNAERLKQGYPAVELVGWAEPPHYDSDSHKLFWARDLTFSKADGSNLGQSLNYDIRVLGRKGYLSLNAVAPIDQLDRVRTDMPRVLAMASFEPGNRYSDYDSRTDKLAAYGIGALVAGGIAAKAGLFAKLGVMLLALKKFIIIGIAAIAGLFKKLFRRKQA